MQFLAGGEMKPIKRLALEGRKRMWRSPGLPPWTSTPRYSPEERLNSANTVGVIPQGLGNWRLAAACSTYVRSWFLLESQQCFAFLRQIIIQMSGRRWRSARERDVENQAGAAFPPEQMSSHRNVYATNRGRSHEYVGFNFLFSTLSY